MDNESKRKEATESDNIIFKLRLQMEPRSAGRISKREIQQTTPDGVHEHRNVIEISELND